MSAPAISRRHPAAVLHLEHRGARLVLRPLATTDVREVLAALDESRAELRRFMPFAHLPQSLEGQLERIQASLSAAAEGRDFSLGLFDAATNRFLVACGLHARVPLNPTGLEIGYWTRTSEAGRGLATLATRALIVYAFEGLGSDRVQISHSVENTASGKVIANCGFHQEGLLRNLLPAPTPEQVSSGLVANRLYAQYALFPEDRSTLAWYAPLRDRIRVVNQLGDDLGFAWRA